jgi:hypothetical protein
VIEQPCPLCRDAKEPGWLCEEHLGQPWEHGGCGAAGVPCVCNPHAQVCWFEIYAEHEPPTDEPRH